MGKKRIALIGGAGFIGHHLALDLAEAGHEVEVIDGLHVNNLLALNATKNPITFRRQYIAMVNERLELLDKHGIPLHVEDARDYHRLSKTLSDVRPDVVVLLAAVAHADRSNKDPYSTFDHSLRTLENALDWSRGNVERFVYFSSSMVYGNFPNGFVTEETPCEPIGVYGALKLAGEKIVIAYAQVFGMPYTIIRPSALYGERCISRRVSQIFIENALTNTTITIHGTGEDRLDFTYVGDLCQGVRKSIELDGGRNETFNLTAGQGRSLGEMALLLQEHFPNSRVNYLPKDKLAPARGTLSIDKAERLIRYKPAYPLEVGYPKYIEWYKSFWGSSP